MIPCEHCGADDAPCFTELYDPTQGRRIVWLCEECQPGAVAAFADWVNKKPKKKATKRGKAR